MRRIPPRRDVLSAVAPVLLLLLLGAAPAAAERPSLSGAERWACFYGREMSKAAWSSLDLAVVDPDGFRVPDSSGPLRIAYVSAGEAAESRSFWREIREAEFLVEPNPEWPGAHRVDPRAEAWRTLLLERVVPEALGKGYDGVFFDTVDVAAYLESSAPVRFAGAAEAMAGLLLETRKRFPDAAILMNNGLDLLPRVEAAIDGLVVEDLYTRCLPRDPDCAPTPRGVSRAKEEVLSAFRARTGKPVFVLVYAGLAERREPFVRKAVARSRELGFYPYLALPSLERLGEIAPGAPRP